MTTSISPAPVSTAEQLEQDYTIPTFARRLQCSARHVWRLIDQGLVPGVYRLGRLVRIHKATADAWLAAGCPARRRGTQQ